MTINKLLNVAKTSTLQLICECFALGKVILSKTVLLKILSGSPTHRCTQGGGVRWEGGWRVNIIPPEANLKTLVNKNAIKPEIGGPPQAIFLESLDPPRDFGKKHQVPPPLDFQPVLHLCPHRRS